MADMGALYTGGRPVGNRQQIFDAGPCLLSFDFGQSVPKSVHDHARHAFTRGSRNGLGQPVRFRIFDIQAQGPSIVL